MKIAVKLLSVVFLLVFLGTMFSSLFHMSMGMDMSEGVIGCAFMTHEEAVCPMNFVDHVGAWKTAFLATASSLTFLIVAAGAAVLIASVAPNLLLRHRYAIPILRKYIQESTYTFSYRPLQELFSAGILHPKLF